MKKKVFPDIEQVLAETLCMKVMEQILKNREMGIKSYLEFKKKHIHHNPKLFKYMELEHEPHILTPRSKGNEKNG